MFNNNGSIHSVTHYCLNGFDSFACDPVPYVSEMYIGINFTDIGLESYYHCCVHFIEYRKCCNNQELCNRYIFLSSTHCIYTAFIILSVAIIKESGTIYSEFRLQ